ncbi:tetratricopeptide repeat protein [Phormidium yuhuli AB48]|uniref:Tetratricopeptide repeat protein n=1 Tax=Phormidium yuhuli AB48 TaxID=2940671 RepID=A0ABY5ALE5_9CYAN|nr:tetratricopeptide repeat protein [Phormidium yuhuli]USR89825.1 tetratricopeptide repeat protein [Phormidium yuhuli AB48]
MSTLEFEDDFSGALERALAEYEGILQELEDGEDTERSPSSEACLQILLLRDKIQSQVTREHSPSTQAVLRLISLDERLSQQGGLIAKTLPLDKFRDLIDPPESAWWWYVQPDKEIHPWDTFNWLWELLTVPILASNFALVAAISSRFLAAGPDALGAFATISQGLIALFAAGAPLSQVGQEVIERWLTAFNLPKYLWHEAKLTLALTVFLGLLGFQSYLPNIARFYVRRGIAAQRQFQTTIALAQFQRALELDPNNMEAHFRLGNLYEDLLEFEQAKAEYRVALLGDCIEAYNNLGRLYIVRPRDYTGAATLLRQGQLKLENRDMVEIQFCSSASLPALESALLKNLGWARLMQGRPLDAQSELRQALEINPYDGASHCLLAQALEAQNEDPAEVLERWQQCYALARGLNPEEDNWLEMARQRLFQAEFEEAEPSAVPDQGPPPDR